MITAIFVTIFLVVIYFDYKAYRRWFSCWRRFWRGIVVTLLSIANFLPLAVMAMFKVFRDNAEWQTSFVSWIFTIYLIVTLSRLVFYCIVFAVKPSSVANAVAILSAATVFGVLVYGMAVTRADIIVEEVEIRHKDIPTTFDGYKIVHFSDLHIGSLLDAEREIDSLVDIINRQDGDLVVFSGDLVHIRHSELKEKVSQRLAAIRSRDGVVAVLGNHDVGVYVKDTVALPSEENVRLLSAKIADMGWRLLCDSTLYIKRGTDSVAVTGVAFSDELLEYKHSFNVPDKFSAATLYESLPDSIFNITVSHLPQLWDKLKEGKKSDLTLAGHVHAMQMKCRIGTLALSPAMLMYSEWSGLYGNEEEGYLYINDGIGSVGYYMRIGANPTVTVYTLKCSRSE